MPDPMSGLVPQRAPSPERPLQGVTLLLVEDSRFACEAIRLMCLRSGARLRRADCLGSARRHLQCYRPTVVIADIGLPDGSGLDLIGTLSRQSPRVSALIAMSGDAGAGALSLAAMGLGISSAAAATSSRKRSMVTGLEGAAAM